MTIDIIAVDPGISDKLITITVKRVIRIDGTGLKGRGYGNRFEGRTKLKGVGNAEVSPHIVVKPLPAPLRSKHPPHPDRTRNSHCRDRKGHKPWFVAMA